MRELHSSMHSACDTFGMSTLSAEDNGGWGCTVSETGLRHSEVFGRAWTSTTGIPAPRGRAALWRRRIVLGFDIGAQGSGEGGHWHIGAAHAPSALHRERSRKVRSVPASPCSAASSMAATATLTLLLLALPDAGGLGTAEPPPPPSAVSFASPSSARGLLGLPAKRLAT